MRRTKPARREKASPLLGQKHMNTLLSPIEKPQGLIMKLAYAMTRRQFGKVITPLKVHSARLPPAFGLFYSKISKLDKKLLLPPETALLIRDKRAYRDTRRHETLRTRHYPLQSNCLQTILLT
jgi:hypothetical protein